jgi:hypothetical protein
MNKLLIVLSVLTLSACSDKAMEPAYFTDQCMRAKLFEQCMKLLPAGPVATKYNDWDEVVSECDSTSRRQSVRKTEFVKPECRAN